MISRRFAVSLNSIAAAVLVVSLGSASLNAHAGEAEKKKANTLVNSAVEYYKANGKDKAFSEISDPKGKFRDGDIYVFVYDMDGNVMAHGQKANLIGKNMVKALDVPGGKHFVEERIQIAKDKGEGWQDYKFQNPHTKKIEEKTSYIKKVDNFIFGAGTYR